MRYIIRNPCFPSIQITSLSGSNVDKFSEILYKNSCAKLQNWKSAETPSTSVRVPDERVWYITEMSALMRELQEEEEI